MTIKTQAATKRETYAALNIAKRSKAYVQWMRLNAQGKTTESFPVWLDARVDAMVASWSTNSVEA